MDRRAWRATVHGTANSRTQLSDLTLSHFSDIAKDTFQNVFSQNVYIINIVHERKCVENICKTGFLLPLFIDLM